MPGRCVQTYHLMNVSIWKQGPGRGWDIILTRALHKGNTQWSLMKNSLSAGENIAVSKSTIRLSIVTPSQENSPVTALGKCFGKLKPPFFLANRCVTEKMTSLVSGQRSNHCKDNFEASRCGDFLRNKNQTLAWYDLCLDEKYQDEAYHEAGRSGLGAGHGQVCDVYNLS